ncbi:hypothetical protein G7Y89_g14223 [Cudoniella acicularis]|uniref:Heterokaryon incompatibility domain-containing protein n=1 Tax=Cudoniella acicularis TaxID=354080 RepID=A0A8H4R3W7_9HELO|nr:hypothetical protein G7Y89_g14223 [Cudoniella acicularis]
MSLRSAAANFDFDFSIMKVEAPTEFHPLGQRLSEQRRDEAENDIPHGEAVDFGTLMATRQQISRSQLSGWDASARAWLRTADEVKKLEQTQLMLVIDNLDIPVNHDMKVYSSVMEVWKTALQSLERMVIGMPQSLHDDGAILLRLSAWHLYPDLLVFSGLEEPKNISIKDPLIKGGVLTIGLQMEWNDDSKAFFTAIGDLFDRVNETDKAGDLSCKQSFCGEFRRLDPNWLQTLIVATRSITDTSEIERDTILRLMNVGMKHGKHLLGASQSSTPIFGLCALKRLLPLLRSCEPKIRVFRQLATRYNMPDADVVIRFEVYPDRFNDLRVNIEQGEMNSSGLDLEIAAIPDETPSSFDAKDIAGFAGWLGLEQEQEQEQDNKEGRSSGNLPLPPIKPSVVVFQPPAKPQGSLHQISHHFEYTSASPQICRSAKRTLVGKECSNAIYQRWLKKAEFWIHNATPADPRMCCDCIGKCREDFCACFRRNTPCTSACQTSAPNNCHDECENSEAARLFASRLSNLQAVGEECFLQDEHFKCWSDNPDRFKVLIDDKWIEYALFAGDPNTAAIFVRQNFKTWNPVEGGSYFPEPEDLWPFSSDNSLYQSLKALAIAAEVYRLLPGATVDISVIKNSTSDWKWARGLVDTGAESNYIDALQTSLLEGLKSGFLNRNGTFSRVAAFESGHCDIDPNLLDGVMALSSGDSIFVAAPLLCDPIEKLEAYELRRILGNVGRTGISMLVPPSNLLIRSVGPEMWNVVNHIDFNGKGEDDFKGTSLHLSFTEYNPPVSLGLHGAQDAEVFILESIVSVHDHGKWIADLDILGVLGNLLRYKQEDCSHGIGELPAKKFTAIDTWDEFLDRPEDRRWGVRSPVQIEELARTSLGEVLSSSRSTGKSRRSEAAGSLDLRLYMTSTPMDLGRTSLNQASVWVANLILFTGVGDLEKSRLDDDEEFKLFRKRSMLMRQDELPVLRICADQGSEGAPADIQVGFPMLPPAGSLTYFKLLREWLRVCDKYHKCHCGSDNPLPTRVLDVGDHENPDSLRLYCTTKGERGRYIALSHCWGKLKENQKFCTYGHNIAILRERIDFGKLPKTFQDAVTVTRGLGERFLWIDSICIIQDDLKDWNIESKKMEAVFSSAYCTIAASSAKDSTEGFLNPRSPVQCVRVPYSLDAALYICERIGNFHRDVEEGELGKRGWVLQERALSRRTIHFTKEQTYWECGKGVHCESLIKMENTKARLLGDPQFPKYVFSSIDEDVFRPFQYLFEMYSKLALTKSTDRSVAISGLVSRLSSASRTKDRYGIFQHFLHRSILWQRSGDKRMKPIEYPPDRKVPSWSWMAYEGEISYVDIPFGKVEWSDAVKFGSKLELQAPVREFLHCTIEPQNEGCAILSEGGERGWLKFDGEDITDIQRLKCIVVGKKYLEQETAYSRDRYILVVAQKLEGGHRTYERVGAGSIQWRYISLQGGEFEARIV